MAYFNQRHGAAGWTQGAMALNLSIGQGDNAQTILNMARFYAAIATGGTAAEPSIVKRATPEMTKMFSLAAAEFQAIKNGMVGVVTPGGTAASAAIPGITLAGKTGTAQTVALGRSSACDHALFAGFAPVDKPEIVVAVILECGAHGYAAARVASAIVGKYFGVVPNFLATTGG
jgi:penicillin-binding protein 2